MTELERLKADMKTLQRCQEDFTRITGYESICTANVIREIECRIAKLEAEAADPWQDAKQTVHWWYELNPCREATVAFYVRHLESEIAAKDARIAKLESSEVPPLDLASLYRRLAAIEQRLDAEDMYRQEQNERSE